MQDLASAPKLFAVDGKRVDRHDRSQGHRAWKSGRRQLGLRRHTRWGPSVVGSSFYDNVGAVAHAQPDHRRKLVDPEDDLDWLISEMLTTP